MICDGEVNLVRRIIHPLVFLTSFVCLFNKDCQTVKSKRRLARFLG